MPEIGRNKPAAQGAPQAKADWQRPGRAEPKPAAWANFEKPIDDSIPF
jgi:hypothetical protein